MWMLWSTRACVMVLRLDAGSRNRCSAGIHDRSSEEHRATDCPAENPVQP